MMWLCLGVALAAEGARPKTHRATRSDRSFVVARDGTRLHTKVIRPETSDPVPTVITRTPYPIGFLLAVQCRWFARRGYACVWQDVRGRGRSEGAWWPFLHEAADGHDTLAWIRSQPWSDGTVAFTGDSYLAGTGWAAMEGEGVRTLVSRVFAPSLRATAFEGGLVRHDVLTAWMVSVPFADHPMGLRTRAYRRALDHRPRVSMDVAAVGAEVPWFRQVVEAERPGAPFWSEAAGPLETASSRIDVPVFFVGGWSDPFVEAQAQAWARLPRRDESLWIIGPWAHLGQAPGGLPLRRRRAHGGPRQREHTLQWLDAHLRGEGEPPHGVYSYVVGGNRWSHHADWPPPTEAMAWSLVPGEGRCDGTLVRGVHPLPSTLTWTYDPDDPYPSRGGAGSLAGAVPFIRGTRPGFAKVRNRCPGRTDVWRFVSPPLDHPLHVAGTVAMDLAVASDAPDTAFGFQIALRSPRGRDRMLREGFVTLAQRTDEAEAYVPGTTVRVRPDGQPLEFEVPAGWSIVVVITSSSFPGVEAHPNVAGPIAWATETQVAHQRVLDATLWLPRVAPDHVTSSSSTSKVNVAFGGMAPGNPRSP